MTESDDLDRAAELSQLQNDSGVAQVRKQAQPEQVKVDGQWPVTDCNDCGEPIPKARIELGRIRCVDCQSLRERARRRL